VVYTSLPYDPPTRHSLRAFMKDTPDRDLAFIAELKSRKVVRAMLLYGAGAFAALQIADIIVEPLGLPGWVLPSLIWSLILGLPVVLLLSWFFDVSRRDEGKVPWLSLRSAAVLALLLIIGLGAGWSLRTMTPESESAPIGPDPGALTTADGNVVAVLPFTVLGSENHAYLSEAVAKLLATSLDGTAGLRAVSSHVVMGYAGLQDGARISHQLARNTADHVGAGVYIIGDVVESGDSLRIEGSLVTGDADVLVSASVTGNIEDLFSAVDELAARLVAEREADSGSERTRTAALTTTSIDALRAYVEGERAFRSGSYLPAIEAFRQAVTADPEFALAFYRLSMTEERLAWAEASRQSAEAAFRHADRLSPRDREFLEAIVALRRGETSKAELMLAAYVRTHPSDSEAWYQLGEIQFHGEPLKGGSMTASQDALESALQFDPSDLGALYHLVRLAIKEGDPERVETLSNRFLSLSPTGGRTLELRALKAASQSNDADFEAVLSELQDSPDTFLPIAVWSVATFGQNPAAASVIARLMTADDRPDDVRGAGHLQMAYLALSLGRYPQALAELDAAEQFNDPDALEAHGWVASMPFLPRDENHLRELLRRLDEQSSAPLPESSRPSSFFSAQNGVHGIVRLYLRGLLLTRLDPTADIAPLLQALESSEVAERARGLAAQLATGLRAYQAVATGDAPTALALLEGLQIEGWYEVTFVSPYHAASLERFMLAELLFTSGRENEALAWYAGLSENTVAGLVFTGPALLRQAEIHRRAGRLDEAVRLQKRFDSLWETGDAELRETIKSQYISPRIQP
jgi:tetratricopeptide (TPR) repeat protein